MKKIIPFFYVLFLNKISEFLKQYFISEEIPKELQPRSNIKVSYQLNNKKSDELGEKVGPIVSFLKSQKNVQTIYVGEPYNKITKYNLIVSYMSDFQSEHRY